MQPLANANWRCASDAPRSLKIDAFAAGGARVSSMSSTDYTRAARLLEEFEARVSIALLKRGLRNFSSAKVISKIRVMTRVSPPFILIAANRR